MCCDGQETASSIGKAAVSIHGRRYPGQMRSMSGMKGWSVEMGENGYITSGAPYSDTFIFQYMWNNFPSPDPRAIPEELPGQLDEAEWNVYLMNDDWKITDQYGNPRIRTFYYCYHPVHQLRLDLSPRGQVSDYVRWTNYETAETGVRYIDEHGNLDLGVVEAMLCSIAANPQKVRVELALPWHTARKNSEVVMLQETAGKDNENPPSAQHHPRRALWIDLEPDVDVRLKFQCHRR